VSRAERAGYAAIFAWTAFASVWIGYEWIEQRLVVRCVRVLREGAGAEPERRAVEFLSRRGEESVAYLIQELFQDEWWDPDLRLSWAARKLLDGRAWPISRRGGRKVALGFLQRRALARQLAEWRSRGEHPRLVEKLSRVLAGETVGTEPLSREERASLEIVAEAWRRIPSLRDVAPKLEQFLAGETLDEVKLSEADDSAFRELAAALADPAAAGGRMAEIVGRLPREAAASVAPKLSRVLGLSRKGPLALSPAQARILAEWGARLRELSYTRALGEKVRSLVAGGRLEELAFTPEEEREIRQFARDLVASSEAGPALELGRRLVEQFGGPTFCDVGLDEEDARVLYALVVSGRERHLARRRRLASGVRRIVEAMAARGECLSRVPQGDIVRLMAEEDEQTRRELALAFTANWLELRRRCVGAVPAAGRPTARNVEEEELCRARNWLVAAAERRSANQTMITATDDRTRDEQAVFLNRRNHIRRLEAIRLILEHGQAEDIARLAGLFGDPDVDSYVRRGMVGRELGSIEPLRQVLVQRVAAFVELPPLGEAAFRAARSVLDFGVSCVLQKPGAALLPAAGSTRDQAP